MKNNTKLSKLIDEQLSSEELDQITGGTDLISSVVTWDDGDDWDDWGDVFDDLGAAAGCTSKMCKRKACKKKACKSGA